MLLHSDPYLDLDEDKEEPSNGSSRKCVCVGDFSAADSYARQIPEIGLGCGRREMRIYWKTNL